MPTYTAPPMRWDHEIIIADTYQPATVELVDADGVAYDLTGVDGEVELAREVGAAAVLTPTVTIDETADTITWSSPPEDTAELSPGTYRYAVRLTWPSGAVRTVLEGTVTARRTVLS